MSGIRDVLKPLAEGAKAGWKLFVDGQEVSAKEMELVSKFGTVRWGATPLGYDQWGFEESGGGGSVLVPFAEVDGEPWVGLVEQRRDFQSDNPVLNLPRGFLDPGANHFTTAVQELEEEFSSGAKARIFPLHGQPGNPNATFFFTRGEGLGVKYFGVRFHPRELVIDQEHHCYMLAKDVLKPTSAQAEKIMGSRFVCWTAAAFLTDQFSNAGVARLLAHLKLFGPK